MKIKVKISGIKYVNEIESYWTHKDFINLLKAFDFEEVDGVPTEELKEMLYMAITNFEPEEAAMKLLEYKLGGQLNKGQIQSLSYEMMEDKVAEEYPEPELHFDLFNINQLLFKAFNGTFPNTEASIIGIEIDKEDLGALEMTEEIMTKLVSGCLTEKSIIKRLYSEQIEGKVPFDDASKFIWTLTKMNDSKYELITSRYWIEKEDIIETEYESNIVISEEED
ncbi:hypothetical protein N9F74_02825 [Flavobacteriaceae bacterium]|nr:hypothetical protein [Flavobacteriaceae bacterium]